jgi:hypothetical protein
VVVGGGAVVVVAIIISSFPHHCGCYVVGELGPPVIPGCMDVPASIVVIVAMPLLLLFCLLLDAACVHPASSRSWQQYLIILSLSSFVVVFYPRTMCWPCKQLLAVAGGMLGNAHCPIVVVPHNVIEDGATQYPIVTFCSYATETTGITARFPQTLPFWNIRLSLKTLSSLVTTLPLMSRQVLDIASDFALGFLNPQLSIKLMHIHCIHQFENHI